MICYKQDDFLVVSAKGTAVLEDGSTKDMVLEEKWTREDCSDVLVWLSRMLADGRNNITITTYHSNNYFRLTNEQGHKLEKMIKTFLADDNMVGV